MLKIEMTSLQERTCPPVVKIFGTVVLFTLITVSDGVKIVQNGKPVVGFDKDVSLTIPCHFTTHIDTTPRIVWYTIKDRDRREVMRFEGNSLTSSGEYLNRVARGDSGNLILISPSQKDSGNYSCEVEVKGDNPRWASATVFAEVKPHIPDVVIKRVQKPVKSRISDASVILPCNFSTNPTSKPRITWFRKVVSFNDELFDAVDPLLENRVKRGEKGNLEITSPSVEDSGTFTCQVQVDTGYTAQSDVTISVSGDRPAAFSGPIVFFIGLLWIVPVLCGFFLEHKSVDLIKRSLKKKMTPKERLLAGWRYIPIVLALCLIFSGIICSAEALSRKESNEIGLVVLFMAYTSGPLLKKWGCCGCCQNETASQNAETQPGEGVPRGPEEPLMPEESAETQLEEKVCRDTEPTKETESAAVSKLTRDEEPLMPEKSTKASSVVPQKPKLTFRTFEKPSNEIVTAMIAMSDGRVYITTPHTLHRFNTSFNNDRPYSEDLTQKDHVIMACKHDRSVLLLTKNSDGKAKVKYRIIAGVMKDKIKHRIGMPGIMKTTSHYTTDVISWLLPEVESDDIYIGYPGSGMIFRGTLTVHVLKNCAPINTSVLNYPACFVKNSHGQLIVADSQKNDVFVFEAERGFVTSMKISVPWNREQEMVGVNRLAVDENDRIYVAGPHCNHVFVFGADFRYEGEIPTDRESSGEITGLLIHNNSLYVAHKKNITIHPIGPGCIQQHSL